MQQGDAAWHDLRDSCAVTWSEAGNALGIGHDSRQAYMKRKLGMKPKKEANWRMEEGTKREPWAAEMYYRFMRDHAEHPVQLWTDAFRRDPADHRLGGSVDRIVTDEDGCKWVLEIKTVSLIITGQICFRSVEARTRVMQRNALGAVAHVVGATPGARSGFQGFDRILRGSELFG